jgi:hypothetical protein
MVEIEQCCDGMRGLKDEDAIQPFTTLGHETAHMDIRGNYGLVRNYNEIKYCPFCAK